MDFDKVDRLHTALSTTFLTVCTDEEATPTEALTAAMRMFSHLVAAYVSGMGWDKGYAPALPGASG